MQEEVYPAVREADALVLLCPNYNDALSANLTAFINRLTALFLSLIHIFASNPSTWDLELESLSVESLLLIYADFRSKQERDKDGNEITILFPLDQSFQVILSKLDNVDSKKRRRYEFVYGKLHDFEDYMRSLGVDVDLTGQLQPPLPHKDTALSLIHIFGSRKNQPFF